MKCPPIHAALAACLALAAGIAGCNTSTLPTSCTQTSDCMDQGRYCQFPVGACGGDGGVCMPIPGSCLAAPALEPRATCGCDGVRYVGGCQAAHAGTSVARYPDDPAGQCP